MGALALAGIRLSFCRRPTPTRNATVVKCRYCGSEAVYWRETQKGWRLFNRFSNSAHRCKEYSRHVNQKDKP